MTDFVFRAPPRIISEIDGLERLGQLAQELGIKRPLLVCDQGIIACGIAGRASRVLAAAGLKAATFDAVLADPPVEMVRKAVEAARAAEADGVIGLGGGSSLDTAKVVALLAHSTQTIEEIYGVDMATGGRLPLIQVPTTAGTGSEVTWVSVITNENGEKKAVYTPQLLPDIALLDAGLTVGMPPKVSAATALDAMVHAIEAYTSRTRKNPVADALARKALELLSRNLPLVLENGQDLQARSAVLEGAMLGGMAFVNASVAAIHGLAYPLGARAATAAYAELARCVLPGRSFTSAAEAAEAFVSRMEEMAGYGGLETRLSQLGVSEADIPGMAEEVVTQIQRLITTNPCDMNQEDVTAIYRSIL
ncbi:MAG: alcohol dehydrogenase [Betaproteobacteria bacterium HGW-Betaproteobacteria-13]|nr:MAG: alcohol dehydrogenase [Betaproteobacteria bacterium HGW-Betaproteobacteria-13]